MDSSRGAVKVFLPCKEKEKDVGLGNIFKKNRKRSLP